MKHKRALMRAGSVLALLAAGIPSHASEGYKLRQPPVGAFGGEIAAQTDNPGFFGTIALSSTRIDRVADENGNDIQLAARSVPLPSGALTKNQIPDGSYNLLVPAGSIAFHQDQNQVNLMAGYLTESGYGDGRIAFAVNLPLIRQSRTFVPNQAAGTLSPLPPAALPAPLRGALGALADAANTQVRAGVVGVAASQNADVSGPGDTELSAVWVRQQERLKLAAGVSLFVPTGAYDKARGPNPGFGKFYTVRPGVAVSYALTPKHSDDSWDSGVTVAGRVSFGFNTRNTDTDYRSGNFVYTEAAIAKTSGAWGCGMNLLSIQQVSDDRGSGAPAGGFRYRNSGIGPFLAYKLPGKEAGFNLQYARNFGSRNALVANTLQLRFIKAW
ncbi:MAG: transporter [Pseudomonadota bacterium]